MADQPFPSDQHLLEAMSKAIWGSLHEFSAAPPYQTVVVSSPDPLRQARTICIVIRVAGHRRLWGGKPYHVRQETVEVQFSVPERDLYMMNVGEAIKHHFDVALRDFPSKVAPRLFEYDPRIGRVLIAEESQKETWCPSPLFDPPGGVRVPFPRPPVEFPLAEQFYKRWTRCGRCKTDFTMGEEVAWGGGHLLWVCGACLGRPDTVTVR